jgi:lipoprotein NlpD
VRAIGLVLAAAVLSALAGCAPQRGAAPVEDRRPPPAAPATKPPVAAPAPALQAEGFYVVKRGDTLYSIALEHGADYREVAQWNDLDDPTRLRVGQVLRVKPPSESSVQIGSGRIAGRVESRPLGAPVEQKPSPAVVREETKLEPETVQFIWPARGKILAGFAEPRQKGIDIDGKIGDPVIAAAAGRVTYVGSGIPGLGKLVVIKHDHGFITVYAHNKDILVKEQQNVTRGQRIAELGNTDAERPKLHFQIRKGSAPVDPLLYLPKS